MSDFTFKEVSKNEYETFMEGKSLNIFFKIPDGCKIEGYNISKTTETPSVMGRPSKAAYFEFTKAPDKDAMSTISPKAGLNFLSKRYIQIGELLHLGDNDEVNVDFLDGASPYFETLNFANNRETTFFFATSSFKKLEEEELNSAGFYSSGITTIEGNANLTLTLGENSIIENVVSCGSSTRKFLANNVNLSEIKYLDCNASYFYPKTNGFTIAVECDIFKFSQATLTAEGKSKKDNTVCLLKNKYKEKGQLNSIILESNDLSFVNNSSLIVDTKSLTFETSPQNKRTFCRKTNKLRAKDQITLMGADLENSQVASDHGVITIIDSELHDATVHFSSAGDESNNGVIQDADIRYSDLKEINGILTNNLFNCNANNVTFEKESFIKYGSLTRDVKGRWLELENVVLKERAYLELYDFSNQESPLKRFSNSTIEGGVDINNDVDYTIESSILKSGEMEIKASDQKNKALISNSILEGDTVLYNVSELTCSEVNNSEIILNKPTKISNQLFSFEDVDDYEAYQKAQEPKFEEPKREVGQITTEDWKVL
jgi:hypothetical protein